MIFWLRKDRLLNKKDPTIILVIICSYVLKKENWKNSIQYQSYESLNVSDFDIAKKLFIATTTTTVHSPSVFSSILSEEWSGIIIYALYSISLIYLLHCPL